MKDFVLKFFKQFMLENSLVLSSEDSKLHKTIILENSILSLRFEDDVRTDDFWLTIKYKKFSNADVPAINVDFIFFQLEKKFDVCSNDIGKEEFVEKYFKLITKHKNILFSPGRTILNNALKLRDRYFRSTFDE